jgi:dolichyl-phosphate-mannose--protein O-mannosyl transferase
MPLEATVPTANGRVDERNRLFTTADCGLSISTRWISSLIADFVFAFLCASLWILGESRCCARNKNSLK